MKKRFFFLVIFIILPLFLVTGYSSWIIVGEKSKTVGTNSTSSYVCYINSDAEGNRYTRIEKALEVSKSGDKVYVVPKTNPTIYKDCTVKSGVYLYFPYEGTSYVNKFDKNYKITSSTFADNNAGTYRKNLITIDEDVTLTIESNAFMFVGGQYGRTGQGFMGVINGNYCEISMKKNSRIVSSGKIECYGFIKENEFYHNNSMVEVLGGSFKVPFSMYDFNGGTATTDMNSNGVCPFDVFDIPNIQNIFRIHSGATVSGEIRIAVSMSIFGTKYNTVDANIISTSSAALLLTSGYVDLKYTPNIAGKFGVTSSTKGESKTVATLYGNMSIGVLNLSVGSGLLSMKINTANYFFPLSYKFDFIIEKGSNITVGQKTKFLPGTKITICEGATFNVTNQVIFYSSDYTELKVPYKYPTGFDRAKLINNGTINITGSGQIGTGSTSSPGGIIETTSPNAKIVIGVTPAEVSSKDDYSTYQTITKIMRGNITNDNSTYKEDTFSTGTYNSYKIELSNIYVWKKQ